jgi:prepilin-type N-terminal cleavage/methylation domain-containing protein
MSIIDIYMKALLKRIQKLFKQKKGFTLIELLVVIGILGILAAALIATIDPFEQLNKAQDANTKNTLVEFIDANVRYYTTHNQLPWNDASNIKATDCVAKAGVITTGGWNLSNDTSANGCIGALVYDGELKSGFSTVTNILNQIYVTGTATNVTACYAPKSKAQRNASDTTNNSIGDASLAGCPNPTATSCYWCSK